MKREIGLWKFCILAYGPAAARNYRIFDLEGGPHYKKSLSDKGKNLWAALEKGLLDRSTLDQDHFYHNWIAWREMVVQTEEEDPSVPERNRVT